MLKRIRKLFDRRAKKSSSSGAPLEDPGREASDVREAEPRPPVTHGPRVVHRPIDHSDLDPDAVKIIQRLTRFDHSAYLVGGCVRDLLLDVKPKDFDIGTSATPRQVRRVFRNSRIIGRRFRLAHVYFQNGKIIEVATFRGQELAPEGDNPDGKAQDLLIRDDNLFGTVEEDALRRDFTINSLFYDVNNETVLDHADGLNDLRRRLVRTIGDPEIRFREDPIRILRAIKFAARLDLRIESKTLAALRRLRGEIPKAAAPRILEEINRFCRGGAARKSFELLRETDILDVLLPEVAGELGRNPDAWKLLIHLLDAIDQRQKEGLEAGTGAILAILLLPAMQRRIGWKADGSAEQPRGMNIRHEVDELVRPMALRLRLSRKDQETCRQIISTLFRMVPARRLRPATRRAILKRECLPVANWILGALARLYAGDFEHAHEYWSRAAEESPAEAPSSVRDEKAPKDEAARGRRRGSRRGGRRRSAGAKVGGKAADDSRAKRAAPPMKAPPKTWDDDYFFSALPSAPKIAPEENSGDRYGADALAASTEAKGGTTGPEAGDEPTAEPAEATTESRGPRKRKRRPRRRRRPAGGGGGSGEQGEAS